MTEIPSYYLPLHQIYTCAFPDEPPEMEYQAIIYILGERMSTRAVAEFMSLVTRREYTTIYFDLLAMSEADMAPPGVLEQVREKLVQCGYDSWLSESEDNSSTS